MATHALPASHIVDDGHTPAAAPSRKASVLRRIYIAILISRMRRAQRDIDRVIEPRAKQRVP